MKKQRPNKKLLVLSTSVMFLAIAASLIAYLVDEDGPLSQRLRLQYGTEFGITIYDEGDENASNYDLEEQIVTPEQAASFAPVIRNDGDYTVYAFIELISTADEELLALSVDDSTNWYKLNSSVTGGHIVYAYGDQHQMKVLEPHGDITSSLPVSILLQPDVAIEGEEEQIVQAVGYAIQAYGITEPDPVKVWPLLQSP